MPTPTMRDVHLDSAMSNISIAYRNELYIAEKVFPVVSVQKRSDYYFIFDRGGWFRDPVAMRAPGTRAKRADYSISTGSYICLNYAIAKAVPDEVRRNADAPLRPDVEATEFVTDALLRAQERRVASLITGSANWAYSSSPTTQWTSDTSDPLGDIDDAINNVVSTIGRMPNTLIMSWDVWRSLRVHPDLLDRVKYVRASGRVEPNDLVGWMGLERVLIGTALYDSAQEGATENISYIWGDDCWLGYVPRAANLMTPAAGYVLQWGGREVRRFREEQERQDVVEASHYTDEVITASDAGAIIYDAV